MFVDDEPLHVCFPDSESTIAEVSVPESSAPVITRPQRERHLLGTFNDFLDLHAHLSHVVSTDHLISSNVDNSTSNNSMRTVDQVQEPVSFRRQCLFQLGVKQ